MEILFWTKVLFNEHEIKSLSDFLLTIWYFLIENDKDTYIILFKQIKFPVKYFPHCYTYYHGVSPHIHTLLKHTYIWYSNHTKVLSFVPHFRLQTSFEYVNIFLNKPSKNQTHINNMNNICNENKTNIKTKDTQNNSLKCVLLVE